MACTSGAILGGASEKDVKNMELFSESVGLAFQGTFFGGKVKTCKDFCVLGHLEAFWGLFFLHVCGFLERHRQADKHREKGGFDAYL